MDNNHRIKGVGGGASLLFSPSDGHLTPLQFGDGGKVTVLDKSRKYKLRNLNAVGGDCGMGCVGSEIEDELRISSTSTSSTRRFKFPKKVFGDCSTVCHVSVPRKLRSAIKKRNRESVSAPLPVCKKLNHVVDGVRLLKKDGSLKSKLKMKQGEAEGCVTDITQGPVTKDEEEVVEALYALSGVFTTTVKTDKHTSTGQGLGANSSTWTKAESFVTPLDEEKVEEKLETVSSRDEACNHSSNAVGSAVDTFRLHCLNETAEPHISIGKQPSVVLSSDIPEVNVPLTTFISENQHVIQKATCNSVVSGASTELSKSRSKLPNIEKSLVSDNYPAIVLAPLAAACSQNEVQHTIKETRNDGSSLRPDLTSATSCNSQGLGIPLQSRSANLPAWFANTSCSEQSPKLSSSVTSKKDAQVAINLKNSWKRCSAHVYISRFIKAFQNAERKSLSMMQSIELTTNKAPKQGANITAVDLTRERNGLTGVVSSDSFIGSAPEKSLTEVRNAILLHKRLVQDQQQASTAYEVYKPQNQNLDFLSLPAGSGRLDARNGISRSGNGPEVSMPLHLSCLLSQNQPFIPFQIPQNYCSSTSFSSHISLATMQKVQMPLYVGSTSYGPSLFDATASSSQQLKQQQQKGSSLFMAQYMSGVASPSLPNKPTGGPDLPPVFQHVQTFLPSSHSSLEVLGPRYAPILQQQQQQQQQQLQLNSANSLLQPPAVKGQYHHLPSGYEANAATLQSDNVPLQIICNQYI
ncbi:hypothetical protein ACH5RR_035236 [Cinchona calisaya]|uniref:Time for coffee n=1 Tax=Cinchona calisaya TaxID=153742 RepID=A0ABD2YGR5_9GENT